MRAIVIVAVLLAFCVAACSQKRQISARTGKTTAPPRSGATKAVTAPKAPKPAKATTKPIMATSAANAAGLKPSVMPVVSKTNGGKLGKYIDRTASVYAPVRSPTMIATAMSKQSRKTLKDKALIKQLLKVLNTGQTLLGNNKACEHHLNVGFLDADDKPLGYVAICKPEGKSLTGAFVTGAKPVEWGIKVSDGATLLAFVKKNLVQALRPPGTQQDPGAQPPEAAKKTDADKGPAAGTQSRPDVDPKKPSAVTTKKPPAKDTKKPSDYTKKPSAADVIKQAGEAKGAGPAKMPAKKPPAKKPPAAPAKKKAAK